jgi:hypothetical protein
MFKGINGENRVPVFSCICRSYVGDFHRLEGINVNENAADICNTNVVQGEEPLYSVERFLFLCFFK